MQRNIHGGDIYSELIEYDFSVNTNPLDCKELYKEILEKSADKLMLYPDPEQRTFREAVARAEGVEADNIWGTNGASEGLMAIVNMLKPKRALLLEPCFAGYRYALNTCPDCFVEGYSLDADNGFSVDEAFVEYLRKKAAEGIDLLIIANPNNPTGRNVREDVMRAILEVCKKADIKLVVDECFLRMSKVKTSMVRYINEFDGLYVVNAFTKLFSIPGIRVGYIVSHSKNINRLKSFTPEWNMSIPAQEAGVICNEFLIKNNWQQKTDELIICEREFLLEELRRMGLKAWDSETCYILFYSEKFSIKEMLLKRRILIRDCSNYEGLGRGYYRIAVKNRNENIILLDALRVCLSGD